MTRIPARMTADPSALLTATVVVDNAQVVAYIAPQTDRARKSASMSRWSYDSRQYRKTLREIQATGPACWICGHSGSDSIHHVPPASLFPDLASDPATWKPAHGVKGCWRCGRRCNQEQGASLTTKRSPRSRRW